jgi:pimeloyl-ACP methyl ester carboxylesterase
MRPEIAVLDIQGQFRVYTEFYRADAAEKTIILVNGSLATTASFAQTVRNLHPQFNVVLYDQPYAGKSKPHNRNERPLTKEVEGQILLELIDHFNAEHIMSFSWGGAAALVALSHRPKRIEKAVISSFSPVINEHMRDYLERGITHLSVHDRHQVGNLVNTTIGKHLPPLFKRFNHRHVSNLDTHEYDQMHHHISDVLNLDTQSYVNTARHINVPVLFLNGEWDEYTAATDVRLFAPVLQHSTFNTIQSTGHFLDMEHKSACRDSRDALVDFLAPKRQPRSQTTYHYQQAQTLHAFAL